MLIYLVKRPLILSTGVRQSCLIIIKLISFAFLVSRAGRILQLSLAKNRALQSRQKVKTWLMTTVSIILYGQKVSCMVTVFM